MFWLKGMLLVMGTLAIAGAGLAFYGASRWARNRHALLLRLEAACVAPAPARYRVQELEGLPAPVQRYFRVVLKEGQPLIAALSVDHIGSFNMSESGEQWKPFTSRQRVVTRRPGFVWDGSVAVLPGLPVRVHDAYIAGEGILHPAILGLYTLLDLRGTDGWLTAN